MAEVLKVKYDMCSKAIQKAYKVGQDISMMKVITTYDKNRFLARYKDMERLRTQLDEVYVLIMEKCIPEQRPEVEQSYDTCMEMFYSTQVIHSTFFEKPTTVPCRSDTESMSRQSEVEYHLPKISLTRFSGVHMEWPNFIAIFNSVIHENNRLTPIQKMHYLLGVLEKEPLAIVKHLVISSSNYEVAYDLLTQRYENKRLIADKYVEAILNLPNLTQINFKTVNKFINTIKENIQALMALKFEVDSWSFLLLHIVLRKLNSDLRTKFEMTVDPHGIPTFKQLTVFLETYGRVLENVAGSTLSTDKTVNLVNSDTKSEFQLCMCCSDDHLIYYCPKFDAMTPEERKQLVIEKKLCFNCLRTHHVTKCISRSVCQLCRGRHHTKLHSPHQASTSHQLSMEAVSTSDPATEEITSNLSSVVQPASLHGVDHISTMVLGTVCIRVKDINGHYQSARALIDSGSQISIMTENLAQKLKLPRTLSGTIHGIGDSAAQQTRGISSCHIKSMTASQSISTDCVIMKKITGQLPSVPVNRSVLQLCEHLILADKNFTIPGQIDMLLGIDVYDQVLDGRRIILGDNMPTAHSSIFGWIIMGKAPASKIRTHSVVTLVNNIDLDCALPKSWETEQFQDLKAVLDPEEVQCEQHFTETHSRDVGEWFIAKLPFKAYQPLGDTYTMALKRFYDFERRLLKDDTLRKFYIAFMQDYLGVGHLRELNVPKSHECCSVPHHGVIREQSRTTKLPAVFAVSAPSFTGVSLNEVLMSGPKLRKNIEDIILRLRTHKVTTFTCDIKQMYRQVLMASDSEHCKYQKIFWRNSPNDTIRQYELATVIYGVTSSPFHAIRRIHELAHLNVVQRPEASCVLLIDTFVDDIYSETCNLNSAIELPRNIVSILEQGCLQLRKWSSNSKPFLGTHDADHCVKLYRFECDGSTMKGIMTKRGILSDITRLYDPCGSLTPVTSYAEFIMQQLWSLDYGWDDALPPDTQTLWTYFISTFKNINSISISRWVLNDRVIECHLHGFSDIRGNHKIKLLLGKPRVAPLKHKRTILKAYLLSRLSDQILGFVVGHSKINRIVVAWSDPIIVISWLQTSPHKLQTYEGNRVSQIQDLIPKVTWNHVQSTINSVDSTSRSLTPSEPVQHKLWCSPPWLVACQITWPKTSSIIEATNLPVIKSSQLCLAAAIAPNQLPILAKVSSWLKPQSSIAWSLWFITNSRNPNERRIGTLSVHKLNNILTILTQVQPTEFDTAIEWLSSVKQTNYSLRRPNSFLARFWQLLRQISHHFWKRLLLKILTFSSTTSEMTKRNCEPASERLGSKVSVHGGCKELKSAVAIWEPGRISRICPGTDGTVRVVELTTPTGKVLRPVVKLCPLMPNL